MSLHTYRGLVGVLLVAVATACGGDAGESSSTSSTPDSVSGSTIEPSSPSTVAPEASTTTTEAHETPTGSIDSPIAVGEVVEIGDWRLRVAGVTADGTEAVLAENQFNDPPAEGRQFFLVHLEATYTGDESSDFWIDVSMKPVGPSSVAYESFEDGCGVIPNAIDDSGETFKGGSIHGDACWSVTAEDAGALVLIVEETFSLEGRAFLSLDPNAPPLEASTSEGVDGSSRVGDAIPVGTSSEVGDWTLTVVEVAGDGTDRVLAENQFNDPPAEDELFFIVQVEATYEGAESSTFWIDVSLKAVGDRSVAYEGFDGSCGVIPDSLDDSSETFPGGTIAGNVCWKVKSDDVDSLVMIAEQAFSFDDTRVYFSLAG